jgi:L-methionine (R)-S-oxide reductase
MDLPRFEAEAALILRKTGTPSERLQALCDFMKAEISRYDWFGFYIARRAQRLLDLGPFAGEPTEHILIPFGRGICGQAAERRETFVVDDVGAAADYLACSLKVKSEIVVPVMDPAGGDVAGEIDIDSHSPAAFGPEDRAFLGRLAVLVAPDLSALRR